MEKSSNHTYNIQKWVNLSTFGKFLALGINLALRTRTPGGGWVGSMQTTADKGGGGSKIGKILQTSFMDGPLNYFKHEGPEGHNSSLARDYFTNARKVRWSCNG